MAIDRWGRPHQTTLTLDGTDRPVLVGRMTSGELANAKLLVRMYALQQQRLEALADMPVLEQIQISKDEQTLNLHFGTQIEDLVRGFLKPVTPWLAPSEVMVVDGDAYVDAYGNEELEAAFWAIYIGNTVKDAFRKNSSSLPASPDGSRTSGNPARGDAPAPTAGPADASGSASPEAAPEAHEASPSGTTTPDSVPSPALSAV